MDIIKSLRFEKDTRFIYVFLKIEEDFECKVLYVGQTNDIKRRIIGHNQEHSDLMKMTNLLFYFPVCSEEADIVESTLALLYNSLNEFNGNIKRNYRLDQGIILLISTITNEYDELDKLFLMPQGQFLLKQDVKNHYADWKEVYFDTFPY